MSQPVLTFDRLADGHVRVVSRGGDIDRSRELTDTEWASIVATVSHRGENAVTYWTALAYHNAGDVVLPPEDAQRLLVVNGEIPTEVLIELGTAAGCSVVQLPVGVELKAASEEVMNSLGWFRQDVESVEVPDFSLTETDEHAIVEELHVRPD